MWGQERGRKRVSGCATCEQKREVSRGVIFNLRLLETHLEQVHKLHDTLILILNAFSYEQETYELVGALYNISQKSRRILLLVLSEAQ